MMKTRTALIALCATGILAITTPALAQKHPPKSDCNVNCVDKVVKGCPAEIKDKTGKWWAIGGKLQTCIWRSMLSKCDAGLRRYNPTLVGSGTLALYWTRNGSETICSTGFPFKK